MKWTAFLLALCATSLPAQQYYTGQAARLLIGQATWSSADTLLEGANERLLGSPSGVAYANGNLYVVDGNRLGATPDNNRVLIYGNIGSVLPGPRDEFPVNDAVRCPICIGVGTNVLGQVDFATVNPTPTPANNQFRSPTGIATNGRLLAVADTDNNRVLVWKSLPLDSNFNQPADLVIGQSDFAGFKAGLSKTQLKGPGGVWLDGNDGLWVADSVNNRVLYFGVPTKNGQEAQLVLGQKDFTSNQQPQTVDKLPVVRADTMLSPISVTTDGTRLYVADQGLNRILIWNSIPTSNAQTADVVIGQVDMTSWTPNDSPNLCASNGTDSTTSKPTYPRMCANTISFPRYALSDGTRLYVSDSGNDRVLVYNTIPNANAPAADAVLGQQDPLDSKASDAAYPERVSASDSFKTPAGLAHDGTNLYVTDVYNRRVVLFTPADFDLPISSVRNAASLAVYALGTVTVSPTSSGGTPTKGDVLTITLGDGTTTKDYAYTCVDGDTISTIIDALVKLINAGIGDPNAIATPNKPFNQIVLTARRAGPDGNSVTVSPTMSAGATTSLATNSPVLTGGQDAARIAPYTLVSILGINNSESTGDVALTTVLPRELANVQVYFDGFRAPIQSVSAAKITAQIPASVNDATSASAVIRIKRQDGSVMVSAPIAVLLIDANPGVFVEDGTDPRVALAVHASSSATATVAVDGLATTGDSGTIYLNERGYTYKVVDGDDLYSIVRNMVAMINESDPEVHASVAFPFSTIRLQALTPGPAGESIQLRTNTAGVGTTATNSVGSTMSLTALNDHLCCAAVEGAPITPDFPAMPGEQIIVYAVGLGMLQGLAANQMLPGQPYTGFDPAQPVQFVNSLVGGSTARVLTCNLMQGSVGIYYVTLELNGSIPTNLFTQGYIAQSYQVSNIFTIPVVNNSTPSVITPTATRATPSHKLRGAGKTIDPRPTRPR